MAQAASATVCVPGTCGELVQGAIDGVTFLVSCPIDLYATVTVVLAPDECSVVHEPADVVKAAAAARVALDFFGRPELGARLRLSSPLPRGKGMGSSTADVAGAIFAVARALGEPITPRQVAELALTIEPSDGSMFPNIALFDHREGRCYEDLGPPPPLEIIVLAFAGEVDTVAFNRQDRSALLAETEPVVSEALALVRRGIKEGRPDLIGRGATLSAEANQRILYKPELAAVQELAREAGAVGVNVGHSGTAIGVLIDPQRGSAQHVLALAQSRFAGQGSIFARRLVGGGCRLPSYAL